MSGKTVYSVVVPVYNEEDCIQDFYANIIPVMESTCESFEVIFINDGSKDRTREIAERIALSDGRIKVINFSRNFGQQSAILCGFENSLGEAVIEIDVDLQDPPEVILEMIEKWKEGYLIVHGKRKKRRGENLFKKFSAFLYYRILSRLAGFKIPEDSGDFKLLDRQVLDELLKFKEHNIYLRGVSPWLGFKETSVEFVRNERKLGETKFTLNKMIKLAGDGIIASSKKPLKLPLKFGLFLITLSLLAFTIFPLLMIWEINLSLTAYVFPAAALLTGIALLSNGITNIYIARIYDEVLNRPRYVVESKINLGGVNIEED